MGTYKNMRVEIPAGTYVQKRGEHSYVYLYTEFFRKDGKPSNKSVCIGKLDGDKLIPNDKYFELFGSLPARSDRSVRYFGYTHLARKVAEKTGLWRVVTSVFGNELGHRLLTEAIFMLGEGRSTMYRLPVWMENLYIPWVDGVIPDTVASSDFRKAGGDKERLASFQTEWIKANNASSSYFYDVTSVSMYSTSNPIAESGYNRDGESLLQCNIGLFTSKDSGLPVFYTQYPGSIVDKTDLEYALGKAKQMGLKDFSCVMDGGFCTEDNLLFLSAAADAFTIGVPGTRKEARRLFDDIDLNEIQSFRHSIGEHGEYGLFREVEFCGVKGRMLVCLNSSMKNDFIEATKKKIELLSDKLSSLVRMPKGAKLKAFEKYFIIKPLPVSDKKRERDFLFELDPEKVDAELRYAGFFTIFTTEKDLSAKEILELYRSKDEDEKCFCSSKVFIGARRSRVHFNINLEGKNLVTFLALVIRRAMSTGLKDYLRKESSLSLPLLISKLNNMGFIKEGNEVSLLNAPSRFIKEAYSILGFDFDKEFEAIKSELIME